MPFPGSLAGSFASPSRRTALSSAPAEPDFSLVTLLLDMAGADTTTSFTDLSSSAHTVTVGGTAQVDTDLAGPFSASSLLLDGNSDYLSVPKAAFNPGTADFTLEMHLYKQDTLNNYLWTCWRTAGQRQLLIEQSSTWIKVYWNVTGSVTQGPAVLDWNGTGGQPANTTGVWNHVAITREGDLIRLHVDGILCDEVAFGTSVNIFQGSNEDFRIGGTSSGLFLYGSVDNVRVTVGAARYAAEDFTAPTADYPTS